MIVAGTINLKMAPRMKLLYEQMSAPKYVIAMGSCAVGGGPFAGGYNVVNGVDVDHPRRHLPPGLPSSAGVALRRAAHAHGAQHQRRAHRRRALRAGAALVSSRSRHRDGRPSVLRGPRGRDRRSATGPGRATVRGDTTRETCSRVMRRSRTSRGFTHLVLADSCRQPRSRAASIWSTRSRAEQTTRMVCPPGSAARRRRLSLPSTRRSVARRRPSRARGLRPVRRGVHRPPRPEAHRAT